MTSPHELPVELAGRPFTAGVLRGKRFRAPFRGVRVPAALPDALEIDCAALRLVAPKDAAVSHATGAALCGLPLPARTDPRRPLHICVGDPAAVPDIDGVEGHEGLDPGLVHVLTNGLPVVHPLRTWCDLVPELGGEDAVVLGDAVVRRWGTLAQLDAVIAGRAGARGVVRMRRLRPLLRERVDSPTETKVRLILWRGGLPDPEVNRDVFAEDGSGWLARPDLSWPAVKVALEYDGEIHRKSRKKWRYDISRKAVLEEEHGWRLLVVTGDDLHRQRHLVTRVRRALRERGLAC